MYLNYNWAPPGTLLQVKVHLPFGFIRFHYHHYDHRCQMCLPQARSSAKCLLRFISFNLFTLVSEGAVKAKAPSACGERVLFRVLALVDLRGTGSGGC